MGVETRPFIFEVLDEDGKRLTMLVKYTEAEAADEAARLFSTLNVVVVNTGKHKGKCCDKCKDDAPCA